MPSVERTPISIHALRALRELKNGAPLHFVHPRVVTALRLRKLVDAAGKLTEAGEALVLPLNGPQPMLQLGSSAVAVTVATDNRVAPELPPAQPDGFVEICCEDFEQAMRARVAARTSLGVVYIGRPRLWWAVRFCPFCGKARA